MKKFSFMVPVLLVFSLVFVNISYSFEKNEPIPSYLGAVYNFDKNISSKSQLDEKNITLKYFNKFNKYFENKTGTDSLLSKNNLSYCGNCW